MKAYRKTVNKTEVYKEYINILNGLLKLSGKEMEVLSLLLEIEATKQPILGSKQDLLCTDNRKALMKKTNINKNNLSKYLAVLKDRSIILKDDNGNYINPLFIPDVVGNTSETVFVLDIED